MPVFVRDERLDEASPFLGRLAIGSTNQSSGFEHAVGGGGGHGGHIGIEHHEGKAAVALQRMRAGVVDDGLTFPGFEPMIPRHQGVVFVGFSVSLPPAGELAGTEFTPAQEVAEGNGCQGVHALEEINDGVSVIRGSPGLLQSSPRSFFVRTSSSVTAAMTSSLRLRRASSCSTFRSASLVTRGRERSKAAAPFSKKVFCQL